MEEIIATVITLIGIALYFINIVYCRMTAYKKNRNPNVWTLFAIFAPVLALIIISLLKAIREPCPNCGADISEDEGVCHRCGIKLKE